MGRANLALPLTLGLTRWLALTQGILVAGHDLLYLYHRECGLGSIWPLNESDNSLEPTPNDPAEPSLEGWLDDLRAGNSYSSSQDAAVWVLLCSIIIMTAPAWGHQTGLNRAVIPSSVFCPQSSKLQTIRNASGIKRKGYSHIGSLTVPQHVKHRGTVRSAVTTKYIHKCIPKRNESKCPHHSLHGSGHSSITHKSPKVGEKNPPHTHHLRGE